jgi:hypothetical protein
MKVKKVLFYLLASLLGGCVLSVHPLFTAEDLVFEEKLLGVWVKEDSKETWEFGRHSDESRERYTIVYTDSEGETGGFLAGLGRLNDMLFLDLYPEQPDVNANEFYKYHLLGVHTFLKIEQIGPALQMRMMSHDKMKEMLEEDPNLIKHEVLEEPDSRILLTASTKELQRFMVKHANVEGLFDKPIELRRLEAVEPTGANVAGPVESEPKVKD